MIHPLFGYHSQITSEMTCSMADVLMQTGRKHNPPEGEYWAVKDGEVFYKNSDANKVQQEAASKGGIMVFPGGSFYIFSISNPLNK